MASLASHAREGADGCPTVCASPCFSFASPQAVATEQARSLGLASDDGAPPALPPLGYVTREHAALLTTKVTRGQRVTSFAPHALAMSVLTFTPKGTVSANVSAVRVCHCARPPRPCRRPWARDVGAGGGLPAGAAAPGARPLAHAARGTSVPTRVPRTPIAAHWTVQPSSAACDGPKYRRQEREREEDVRREDKRSTAPSCYCALSSHTPQKGKETQRGLAIRSRPGPPGCHLMRCQLLSSAVCSLALLLCRTSRSLEDRATLTLTTRQAATSDIIRANVA